eukprot:gnl/TRDRNA2_/TRDRNA2_39462_c0_seq1.p1 gnl/TRDRNA2_/TRDRNA2_39462_c0~~gnl/TRDRNA2_/TRDRNA2_39462_c0_seq1.p1  ORF type:complete len:429 (-),score=121.43 gnl/TRDRNA2_/TRDRNA2_39462_c0_seq1:65-1273(-)
MAAQAEHKEYIQQKVNPILENLVTQLLLERPEQLAPFMIKWLSEHTNTPAASATTEGLSELASLKSELEQLQQEVKSLEAAVGADKAGGFNSDEEEEEEEDDDGEELPPPPPPSYFKARASVSAEAYGKWNQPGQFTPPVHPKSDEQKVKIKSVLAQSFLFSTVESADVEILVNAMLEKIVEPSEKVITQGEDGDCLFVIEAGCCDCFKKADGEEKKVKECGPGDAFGELALLYNCPRAASVVARERCTLWQLDRETFNNIVKIAAIKKRERFEETIQKCPLLLGLQTYERLALCDALQSEEHKEGASIIKQGDPGDKFYIVEAGECRVEKVYVPGTPAKEVMQYKPGDYFGELALIKADVRAATVIAKTDCRLLYVDRRTFKLLLGPLEELMSRDASQQYK